MALLAAAMALPADATLGQTAPPPPDGWFNVAAFGVSDVTLSDASYVDSYSMTNPLSENEVGDCRSNEKIQLKGTSAIHGSVWAVDKVIEKEGTTLITGYVWEGVPPVSYPGMDDVVAERKTSNDNAQIPEGLTGTAFNIGGTTTVTIPAGEYYFSDFKMSGSARLVLTGPAVFYTDGPMRISGDARLNDAGDPMALLIISSMSLADGEKLTFTDTARAWGLIYATTTRVQVQKDAHVFGAVVALQVRLSDNGALHVPEELIFLKGEEDLSQETVLTPTLSP